MQLIFKLNISDRSGSFTAIMMKKGIVCWQRSFVNVITQRAKCCHLVNANGQSFKKSPLEETAPFDLCYGVSSLTQSSGLLQFK